MSVYNVLIFGQTPRTSSEVDLLEFYNELINADKIHLRRVLDAYLGLDKRIRVFEAIINDISRKVSSQLGEIDRRLTSRKRGLDKGLEDDINDVQPGSSRSAHTNDTPKKSPQPSFVLTYNGGKGYGPFAGDGSLTQIMTENIAQRREIVAAVRDHRPVPRQGSAQEWLKWLYHYEADFDYWFSHCNDRYNGTAYSDLAWGVMNDLPPQYIPEYPDRNDRIRCKYELIMNLEQCAKQERLRDIIHLRYTAKTLSSQVEYDRFIDYIETLFSKYTINESDELCDRLETVHNSIYNAHGEVGRGVTVYIKELRISRKSSIKHYYMCKAKVALLDLMSKLHAEVDTPM